MEKDKHFAALPVEEIGGAIEERIQKYYDVVKSDRFEIWRRCDAAYFGADPNGTDRSGWWITSGGEYGEKPELRQNEFRSVLRHILTVTTGTRPAFTAKATTTDYQSQAARRVAEALIEQSLSEGNLEDVLIDACESSIYLGEGYVYLYWDKERGDEIGVEEFVKPGQEALIAEYEEAITQWEQEVRAIIDGHETLDQDIQLPPEPEPPDIEMGQRILYNGEPRAMSLPPDDVIRDPDSETFRHDMRWVIIRRRVNRFSLIAQYPDAEEHLLRAGEDKKIGLSFGRSSRAQRSEDEVTIFELYHESCNAVPGGRHTVWCDGEVIDDEPLPYDTIPVHPCVPYWSGQAQPFGYGAGFDLLALQQALDAAISCAVANHDALGDMKLWAPPGSGAKASDLGGGIKLIQSTVKPEGLQLLESNKPSFEIADGIRAAIERLSGVSAVTRGEPQASLKSGISLAFMNSLSIQANSGIQRAYARCWERVATALMDLYRRYATEPRLIEISGRSTASNVRQFKGEDLDGVKRISVDLGNPLLRTPSGRMEIAEKLFQRQAVSPQQFLEVISTGRLDAITERPEAHRGLIASENERLRDAGDVRPVRALKTDDHRAHIPEHLAMLDDPDARNDDQFVMRVLGHIDEHIMLAQQVMMVEPVLMELSGQPPLQSVMQQMQAGPPVGGPPPGAAPPQPAAPPPPDGPPPAPMPGVDGTPAGEAMAGKMPRMPDLPETAAAEIAAANGAM